MIFWKIKHALIAYFVNSYTSTKQYKLYISLIKPVKECSVPRDTRENTFDELQSTASGREQWQRVFLRGWYWNWCSLTSLSATQAVGLSAVSASHLCWWYQTVWCWRDGMPCRGTWTSLGSGSVQTSYNSTTSCAWAGAIPSTNAGWVMSGLGAALQGRMNGSWLKN